MECCVCDCLRLASLWRPNSRGDSRVLGVHFSNVFWSLLFVFLTLAYFKSFLKVYYRIFQSCLLKLSATAGACINKTGLFGSTAVVPQSSHELKLGGAIFIMIYDIIVTGQTNILALCYLFGKIYKPAYSSAILKSLKSTHSTKLLKRLLT